MDHLLLSSEIQFLTLLTVAAGIAVAVKYVRLPYTIALVFGGLLVSLTSVQPYNLTQELILFIFLPPLLFEGAIHFELTDLKRNMKTIGSLAFPGLVISGFLAGFLIQWMTGLPLAVAVLVGVMITPTDPISVLALFKKLGVSKRLSMIVEGESVFNDGTGIVLYTVVLGMVTSGTMNLGSSIFLFLKVVIGGLLIGLILGQMTFLVLKRLDDHVLEVLITILLAFSSFLVAEHTFNVSGVMAVVAAGVIVGNQGARFAMSPTTRIAIKNFWEIAAFLINSLIFLMIGTHTHISELWSIWPFILGGFVIVTAARALSSYTTLFFLKLSGESLPGRWFHVINWGGIHGSVPVALALGLPNIPHRTFIVDLVFGIVFLSLTVQGLSMGPLVRILGLAGKQEEEEHYEETMARSVMLRRALDELRQKRDSGRVSETIYQKVTGELQRDLEEVKKRRKELENNPKVQRGWEIRTRQSSLAIQKGALYEMMVQGDLSHEAAEVLMGEIDGSIQKLESEEEEERDE